MEANILPINLRDDAPYQTCLLCGRKTWDQEEFGQVCNMTQPNGNICKGTFSARVEKANVQKVIVEHGQPIAIVRDEEACQVLDALGEALHAGTETVQEKEVELNGNVLTIRRVIIDLVKVRDTLLALRDGVFCPFCRCPNWTYEEGQRVDHYSDCNLGKLTEAVLRIVPKDHVRLHWKSQ
jgi:hypothetical protein